MTAGLGLLRLSPDAFWAMTPGEFACAARAAAPEAPAGAPRPADLAQLIALFPDR